jgi:hypothetical protein
MRDRDLRQWMDFDAMPGAGTHKRILAHRVPTSGGDGLKKAAGVIGPRRLLPRKKESATATMQIGEPARTLIICDPNPTCVREINAI